MLGVRCRAILAGAFLWPAAANAQPFADCYDARVSAVVVDQVPTTIPECRECIIVRWPWFIDLDVRSTIEGDVAPGRITVLSVQHTGFNSGLGERRWGLRMTDLGVFNLVDMADDATLPRCEAGAPAVRPYIRPGQGQTLDDLRREGEAQYGGW